MHRHRANEGRRGASQDSVDTPGRVGIPVWLMISKLHGQTTRSPNTNHRAFAANAWEKRRSEKRISRWAQPPEAPAQTSLPAAACAQESFQGLDFEDLADHQARQSAKPLARRAAKTLFGVATPLSSTQQTRHPGSRSGRRTQRSFYRVQPNGALGKTKGTRTFAALNVGTIPGRDQVYLRSALGRGLRPRVSSPVSSSALCKGRGPYFRSSLRGERFR